MFLSDFFSIEPNRFNLELQILDKKTGRRLISKTISIFENNYNHT